MMSEGEVAHCTGAGWPASYVENPGLSGRFLSPLGHYMSRWNREPAKELYTFTNQKVTS